MNKKTIINLHVSYHRNCINKLKTVKCQTDSMIVKPHHYKSHIQK